jgi:predicted metal-dependent peptidase
MKINILHILSYNLLLFCFYKLVNISDEAITVSINGYINKYTGLSMTEYINLAKEGRVTRKAK